MVGVRSRDCFVLMYVGILFSLSMLVCLVRPCSMHICILFSLSTLVRLVWPCPMYAGILFGLSTAMSYVCWYFIRS